MKGLKVTAIVVGLLLVVIVAVVAYLATNANRLVKGAIESLGTAQLGTRVSVGEVDLSLQESRATIRDFQIDNPKGYEGPYVIRLDEISVVLDVASTTTEMIVIQRIVMDGAAVAAVVKSKDDTNFQAIMDNLAASGDSADEPGSDEAAVKLVIDRLDFVNAKARASSPFLSKEVDVDLPDLHLTLIGRKDQAVTAAEATRQIYKPIAEAVIRESLKSGLGADQVEEEVRGKLDETLDSGLDKLKKLGS
jgi:uncharacterized protein involved in outer membrane biogenesis